MRDLPHLATSLAFIAGAVASVPAAAPAQLATPSGVRTSVAQSTWPAHTVDGGRLASSGRPARVLLAAVGSTAGLFAGAIIGWELASDTDCACEDPGIRDALTGAAIGAAVGAALLAAIPRTGAECRYGDRLWRGLIGAALGTALGLAPRGNAQVLTVPAGAAVGGAVGAESCAWQRHD